MKSLPLKNNKECKPEEATHLLFRMPGPIGTLCLPVQIKGSREGTSNWTWNGSVESPTLRPSVRSRCIDIVCHSWINDGKAQFLDDTTHEFKGKTVDLLELTDGIKLHGENGEPLACPKCGRNDLEDITKDSIEHTVCEFEVRCNTCNTVAGYWAYGFYERDEK